MRLKLFSLVMLCALILNSTPIFAEPFLKIGSTTTIKEALTPDMEAQLKGQNLQRFNIENVTDQDLAKLIKLFPDMDDLQVRYGKHITTLAPLATLKNLRQLTLGDVAASDMTPLAELVNLTNINIDTQMTNLAWMSKLNKLTYIRLRSSKLTDLNGLPTLPNLKSLSIAQAKPNDLTPITLATPNLKTLGLQYDQINDLTPLTKLANLEDLDLYGAHLKDFSPLSKCPKLKKVTYYATKEADYSTLGKLTQVTELFGGLSQLTDIAWIENLPNLKKFTLFAEPITDYTPLSKSKLEYLKIWSMREPANLEPVGKIKTLKELVLWSLEGCTGNKALAGLTNLQKLTINDFNKKKGGENFDLASAANWKNLKDFSAQNTQFDNFKALSNCTNLEKITLIRVMGVDSLAPIKKLPHLKYVRVSKDLFPASELEGFAPSVKISK